jgi:hypothetical protein
MAEPVDVNNDDDGSDLDPEPEMGSRFQRYRRQRERRGLPVPTWGEWLRTGSPLYEED